MTENDRVHTCRALSGHNLFPDADRGATMTRRNRQASDPTMLIPPLRTPLEYDIKGSLSSWLDETKNNVGFLSSQVYDDLDRLASLRNSLVRAGSDHKKALDVLQNYKTYHAALLGCEAREFPSHETPSSARHLQFPWQSVDRRHNRSTLSPGMGTCQYIMECRCTTRISSFYSRKA